jgi:hypothetical protein
MPQLRDVDIDNFPCYTKQSANARCRTSDEIFDEFCGLFFDTFVCTVMFEDQDGILLVSQQVDPVVTILKFALMMDGMNPRLRLLLS